MKASLLIMIVILGHFPATDIACQIPAAFNCSDVQTKCDGANKITSQPNTVYDCQTPLTLSAPELDIQGFFSSLILTGDNITLSNVTTLNDLVVNVTQYINISWQLNIGDKLVIGCNSSQNAVGQISGADIMAKKIIILGLDTLTIQNSELMTTWNMCLYQNISIVQVSNYINQSIVSSNISALASQNISIFIIIQDTFQLLQSTLTGVAIAINTQNAINLNQSIINATAQSCRTNTGLGRGAIIQYSNTYCTSGSSSCGFGEVSNTNLCSDVIQYFLFLSHSFPYISKGPYLFTGSGGYGYNYQQDNRGAGGGIIFIYAKTEIVLSSSQVQASGGSVNAKDSLSAGSGGTVFLNAKKLVGLGANNISASGGDSYNDQGGGGGGLIKISYSSVQQEASYSLWININQGYQSNSPNINMQSNGIFYGPLCHGGNMAYYLGCISCNDSWFSTLGDPVCRPCPTSQSLDINTSYLNKSMISNCFSVKKESTITQLLSPGAIDVLNIGIYLIALIVFTIVGVVLKKKIKKEKMLSGEEFRLEDVQKDIEKAKILALQLRKSKDIKPYELMYHAHRISCFGSNSQSSPWVLPSTAPHEVRKYVLPQVYCNFAQNFNSAARWSKAQYWLTIISSLVYPVYWYYLDRVKKRKYKKLWMLLENAIDFNLINNFDYEDRSIVTIKFSKNKDYTNCYLDFFVYQRADLKYFTLVSPYILYLSGQGNFLRPFYLEQGDIFFRLMFFVVNREFLRVQQALDEKKQLFSNMVSQKKKQKNNFQLNRFLRKLNTLACTLDLAASNKIIVQVLWNLVQFIDKWNQQFFNKMAVQLDLVIFMSRLMNKTIIDNQIHILTKKDKQQFETFIMEKIKEIGTWEESSIKIGLFVYNPEQELPKEDEAGRSLLQDNELLLSGDDHEEAFMRSLLISQNKNQKKKLPNRILTVISRGIGIVRYFMMSHKNSKYDEYTIKFLQSFLILLQTMLVFIWSIRLQIPYVFVNLIMPFIGIIWFVSDSYGFGKLYLIFNAMSLINEIVTIIVYSWVESIYLTGQANYNLMIIRNIICSLINICIILFMMFLGNRAITQSKKLSLKKEDQNQPLKFE